jgi:hypothetical protein
MLCTRVCGLSLYRVGGTFQTHPKPKHLCGNHDDCPRDHLLWWKYESGLQYLISIPVEMDEEKYMARCKKKRPFSVSRSSGRSIAGLGSGRRFNGEDEEMDGYVDVEMTERGYRHCRFAEEKIYDFGQ